MQLDFKLTFSLLGLLLILEAISVAEGQLRRRQSNVNRVPYSRSSQRLSRIPSYGKRIYQNGAVINPYKSGVASKRANPVFASPPAAGVRRPASVSIAKENSNSRNVGIGDYIDLNSGRTNTKTVSKTNGGIRNGGTTSISKSNAQTQGLNLGGLGVSNTVTRTKTNDNGQVSRGIANDFNVGGLNLGTSYSRENLNNVGIHRNSDGSIGLGLGLFNFDVGRSSNPYSDAGNAASSASATGTRAKTKANARTNSHDYGLIDYNTSRTNSKAVGIARHGQSSASTTGQTSGQGSSPIGGIPFLGGILGRKKRDLRIQQYTGI